jgi:hypothetical protein
MKQRASTTEERRTIPFEIDGDTIHPDAKGDLPTLYAPDEWTGR